MTVDEGDKTFCQGYIDYLLTEYHSQRKPVFKFIAQNYYRGGENGALNTAVRANVIKLNPFTKIGNSDKIHRPDNKREYLTIEELRALIATSMKNALKQAYLFSCFCGLWISDIIGLKWENVYVDNGQYWLVVMMQKTIEQTYLPLLPEALRWMPERGEKSEEDVGAPPP